MAIFVVLWPYLLTSKLRWLQKNNLGHTKAGGAANDVQRNELQRCCKKSKILQPDTPESECAFASARSNWVNLPSLEWFEKEANLSPRAPSFLSLSFTVDIIRAYSVDQNGFRAILTPPNCDLKRRQTCHKEILPSFPYLSQ